MGEMLSDTINDLPQDVIDNIFSFLPLLDAVRTSILSTKWRFHWTRKESLVLDEYFFKIVFGRKSETEELTSKYLLIVGNILSSHSRRIQKLALHIPNYLNMASLDVINQWILSISRCGVRDLTFDLRSKLGRRVPSHLFYFRSLKHLSLRCVSSPSFFAEIPSLRSLDLSCHITSGNSLTNIISRCPLLERFSLFCKTNCGSLVIKSSKLEHLCVKYCYGFSLILENTARLSTVSLTLTGIPTNRVHIKCQSMFEFFGAAPKIENISVTSDVLVEWAKQFCVIPEKLSRPLGNLSNLVVRDLNLYSREQINTLFCLINSSPKLQTLDVEVYHGRYGEWNYLRSQLIDAKNTWNLRTLKVSWSWIYGHEPENVFIKIFLKSCPLLEKVYLDYFCMISNLDVESKMLKKLRQFHAASSKLQIISSRTKS